MTDDDDDDDDDDDWLKFYAESPIDFGYRRYPHVMRKQMVTLSRWCHVEHGLQDFEFLTVVFQVFWNET